MTGLWFWDWVTEPHFERNELLAEFTREVNRDFVREMMFK